MTLCSQAKSSSFWIHLLLFCHKRKALSRRRKSAPGPTGDEQNSLGLILKFLAKVLRRKDVLGFLAQLPKCLVGVEALERLGLEACSLTAWMHGELKATAGDLH